MNAISSIAISRTSDWVWVHFANLDNSTNTLMTYSGVDTSTSTLTVQKYATTQIYIQYSIFYIQKNILKLTLDRSSSIKSLICQHIKPLPMLIRSKLQICIFLFFRDFHRIPEQLTIQWNWSMNEMALVLGQLALFRSWDHFI